MLRLALIALLCVPGMAQPRRIISTAPSITEMLFALGLGDRVVGVTDFCHYPPEVRKIAKIGTWLKPNLEQVLSLKPDLIVVQRTAIHSSEQYAALKLKTVEVQHDSIANIYESLRTLGGAAGVQSRAAALVASTQKQLDEIRQRAKSQPRVKLMFVVGRTPGTLDNLIVVGKRSYLTEVMEIAGGTNAFDDAPVAYPKISHEELLARDPDVILDMGEMAETTGVTDAQKQRVVELYSRYPKLKAVRNRRVHAVANDMYVVPGPRVTDLAREFFRLLHTP